MFNSKLLFIPLLLSCFLLRSNVNQQSIDSVFTRFFEDEISLSKILAFVDTTEDVTLNIGVMEKAIGNGLLRDVPDSLQARFYFKLCDSYSATARFGDGVKVARQLVKVTKNERVKTRAYARLASLYNGLGIGDSALYFLNQNYEILKGGTDTAMMIPTLFSLGNYHAGASNYEKAIQYYRKARKLALASNEQSILMSDNNMAYAYYSDGNLDSAEQCVQRVLMKQPQFLGGLNQMALILEGQGKLAESIDYLERAYSVSKDQANDYFTAGVCNNLADASRIQGKYDQALKFAKEGKDLSEKVQSVEWLEKNLMVQKGIYEAMGNYKQALGIREELSAFRDSVEGAEVKERIAELEVAYDLKEKSAELELQESRNELQKVELDKQKFTNRISIVLVAVFLVVAAVFFVYNRKLNKAQKELAEANAIKDRFFAIVAHEMLGSVSAFSGIGPMMAEMTERGKYDEVKAISQDLEDEAVNLKKMLDNLLQWAFVQLDRIKIKPERIKLKEVTDQVVGELGRRMEIKEINVKQNFEQESILFDRDSLVFVLRNLISNAIKFSYRGGEVRVTSSFNNGVVLLKVADDGLGMSENVKDGLFDLSKKSVHQGTEGEAGNGLGLILAREFVERNEALLEVSSELGKGTVFVLKVPVS